jgi:hypothetical protein
MDTFDNNINTNLDGTKNVSTYVAQAHVEKSIESTHESFISASETITSLKDYLSRPKLLYDFSFDDALPPVSYQYMYDFLRSPDILEKTKYFHLIKGNFSVKVVLTTAPYATGMVTMSRSFNLPSEYSAWPADNDLRRFNLRQKESIDMDLGRNPTMLMKIPFHINTPYVKNDDPHISELQKQLIWLYNLTPLSNSQSGSTVKVYVKIYVSLDDAEVSVPTPVVATYTSEIQATRNGPISFPASLFSMASKAMAPVFGRYAMATSIASEAVGDIAKLFGFSRPRDLGSMNYPHAPSMAVGEGEIQAKALTLDALQETTISSSMFGEVGDNLSFQNTMYREGIVDTYDWLQTDIAGTQVFSISIAPCICSVFNVTRDYYVPTPLAYIATLFRGWRGSLKFRIVIPGNSFIRGKLRIYWSSDASVVSLQTVTNNALSVLLDLSTGTEAEITVPYLQHSMFRQMTNFIDPTTTPFSDHNRNGVLVAIVEEPIIANNAIWSATVVLFISAGPDFEVCVPTNVRLPLYSYYTPPAVADVEDFTRGAFAVLGDTAAENQETAWFFHTSLKEPVNPEMKVSLTLMPTVSDDRPLAIHIGEKILSLRTVLKRFSMYSYVVAPNGSTSGPTIMSFFFPYRPNQHSLNALDQWYNVANTPLAHVMLMFAGIRGSVRYHIQPIMGTNTQPFDQPVFISRGYGYPSDMRGILMPAGVNIGQLPTYFSDGFTWLKSIFEGITFDIPFQAFHWYEETTFKANAAGDGIDEYGAYVSIPTSVGIQPPNMAASVAIGEDFQCVVYNGPPIVTLYEYPYVNTFS